MDCCRAIKVAAVHFDYLKLRSVRFAHCYKMAANSKSEFLRDLFNSILRPENSLGMISYLVKNGIDVTFCRFKSELHDVVVLLPQGFLAEKGADRRK